MINKSSPEPLICSYPYYYITSGFAIVWKSISSFRFCTQNNVFVVDEESRGWGIVSFCVPGGGE